MDKPIVRIASRLAPVAAVLLLAACGNKGPLVRAPEAAPPVVPVAAEAPTAAELEGTLPDTTPPEQPAAPDVVAPPPADDIDETQPPPPPATDADPG